MEDDSRARLETLLAEQRLAVIATTCADGAPYASLVAFAAQGERRLYFATPRATRKWHNIDADARVAVLLDDRTAAFHEAAAATGVGTARECSAHDAASGRDLLLSRHPHLEQFVDSPSTVLVMVDVERWYVVTRFQSVDCIACREHEAP